MRREETYGNGYINKKYPHAEKCPESQGRCGILSREFLHGFFHQRDKVVECPSLGLPLEELSGVGRRGE
jgi:hypothetical protein